MMNISKRIQSVNESTTMRIAATAKEMQRRGENVIDFSVGEPDFNTPVNIKDAAKRALDNNQTHYTLNQGTFELRQAIAQKLKNENGLNYLPENIIVSTGAKQCLYNAIQSVIEVDDEVIIPAPYYMSYAAMVKLAGGIPVFINTDEETEFNFTCEQLEHSITSSTKVLILSYPTNPTGACYSEKQLNAIANIVEKNNLIVICDDIYENLIYDDNKFICFASLNENIKNRTIVVNGFSKSYAMTGWRIGYAAASLEFVNAMNKLQGHVTSNASSISQAAALEALYGPQDSVAAMKKEFESRRNLIFDLVTSIDGIKCFKPKGAFYLFPNVSCYFGKNSDNYKIENSYDLAMYLLKEAKVATVPGNGFGKEGHIRISFSTLQEKIKEGIGRIRLALQKLSL